MKLYTSWTNKKSLYFKIRRAISQAVWFIFFWEITSGNNEWWVCLKVFKIKIVELVSVENVFWIDLIKYKKIEIAVSQMHSFS